MQLIQVLQVQQLYFSIYPSRRDEGSVEWLGGPLWSPAASLNYEALRHIAIDKGVKHANID
jgi:hypothetical protein